MHELVLAVTGTNLVLSAGLFWYQTLRLKAEKVRADRYASAILHMAGEPAASRIISPKPGLQAVPKQAEAIQRPRQVGLYGR